MRARRGKIAIALSCSFATARLPTPTFSFHFHLIFPHLPFSLSSLFRFHNSLFSIIIPFNSISMYLQASFVTPTSLSSVIPTFRFFLFILNCPLSTFPFVCITFCFLLFFSPVPTPPPPPSAVFLPCIVSFPLVHCSFIVSRVFPHQPPPLQNVFVSSPFPLSSFVSVFPVFLCRISFSVPTGTDQNPPTHPPTNGLGRHSAFQPEPARPTMETYSHDVTPPPAISQLPTELLIKVLEWALPSSDLVSDRVGDRLHSYMRILYTLRLVGKRWQEIIDGTPRFWKFVLSTLPSHVNEAIILRSNNGPLAIVYSAGRLYPEAFLQGIKVTRHRWSAYRGPIVRGYFDTSAPLLQHVSIDGRLDCSKPLDLLGGYSTKLRHVDLSCLSIPWKIGLFTHLHVLKLRGVGQNGLTTGHLLDFLHASPRLEVLNVTDVDAVINNGAYSSAIILSHLRSIEVCGCELGVVAAILSHIRAPSCIEFFLELPEAAEPNLPNFLEVNLRHFRGPLRAIHKHAGLSKIILEGQGILWLTPARRGGDHKFCLLIRGAPPLSWLQFVERTLHSDSGLNFPFGDVEDISETLSETFAPMPWVTKVEIRGRTDRDDARRILGFLGEVSSTQPLLPSLPGLGELKLTSVEWDAEDLMKMVHSRFDTPSRDTVELSRLSIVMSREAFSWAVSPPPILNYVVLSKIRNSNGIESVRFSDLGNGKGMLGITWDEETSKPVWG